MKMKCLFAFIALIGCGPAQAQISWNAHIGLLGTRQQFNPKIPNNTVNLKNTGFLVGGNLGVRLYKSIWSETGLSWSGRKFGTQTAPAANSFTNLLYRVNYLTLHQFFLLKVETKNKVSFHGGAGFFGGMAAVGVKEVEISNTTGYTVENQRLKIGSSPNDDIKRVDAGLSILLRAQFNFVLLTLMSTYGLTEHPTTIAGTNYEQKFKNFYFGVGYVF